MKEIIFLGLFLIALIGLARADVYVITDQNKSVYSISDQNDAVLPKGYTLTVMKGQNINNLPISGNPQLYNFNNGSFTLNSTAVQVEQTVQTQTIAAQTAAAQAKANAIAKLTDAISKVATQDVLTQQELEALLPQ